MALIYCIVVRRFMHLDVNENEYLDPNAEKIPKQENAIPRLKLWFLKFLESGPVEMFSMIVIAIYTVFTLFWLTHSGFLPAGADPIDNTILGEIDGFFLWFFLVEIVLKSFASSWMYVRDTFNFMDFIIVVLSVGLNLNKFYQPGLGALRLVRVVVIIVRKISGDGGKLRHQNKFNNPVESVIKILVQITELNEVSPSIKKEAMSAIDLIESNKLYELNFDISNDQKNMDMDAKAWLNITTDVANDTTKWFERDLDDFLKEIHRENDEVDPQKLEEEDEKLKSIIEVQPRVWNHAIKMMDEFDKWNFDIFKY